MQWFKTSWKYGRNSRIRIRPIDNNGSTINKDRLSISCKLQYIIYIYLQLKTLELRPRTKGCLLSKRLRDDPVLANEEPAVIPLLSHVLTRGNTIITMFSCLIFTDEVLAKKTGSGALYLKREIFKSLLNEYFR